MQQSTVLSEQLARQVASSQNVLGLKLLSRLVAREPQKNLFISPLSVYTALTMAEAGAAAATQQAMRRTLEVPGALGEADFHYSVAAFLQVLQSRPEIQLSIANSLWCDQSFSLSTPYARLCRELFRAEVSSLAFGAKNSSAIINEWADRNTKGKIPSIVTQRQVEASSAIVANAVYFKGLWRNPFGKQLTADGIFQRASGESKSVPFMAHPALDDAYCAGNGFEAAELPYGRSGLSFFALLPAPGKDPESVLARLSPEDLLTPRTPSELNLKLPRLRIGYDGNLRDSLAALGMDIAFRLPGADFTPIGSPQFCLGDVVHKTVLEVDEEGAVAAAVTVIAAPAGIAQRPARPGYQLNFNRPFAFVILDSATRAILFAGVVYEP